MSADVTHSPVEQTIVATRDDLFDEWEDCWIHTVVCGCDEKWAYEYGRDIHV